VSSLQAQLKEASNKVSALQAQLAKVQAELDEERTKVERAWSKRECTIGSIA
jgi:peptidoglycan hydrolase CwlO-like protein